MNNRYSSLGSQLGSSLGSAAGAAIPIPGVGPLIGGTIGSIGGKLLGGLFDKKQKAPLTIGEASQGFYMKGGKLYMKGGKLKGKKQFIGKTHEQGGIKLPNGAEVEHGETIEDDYVFSNRLLVPGTNLTFAEKHKQTKSKKESLKLQGLQERISGREEGNVLAFGGNVDGGLNDISKAKDVLNSLEYTGIEPKLKSYIPQILTHNVKDNTPQIPALYNQYNPTGAKSNQIYTNKLPISYNSDNRLSYDEKVKMFSQPKVANFPLSPNINFEDPLSPTALDGKISENVDVSIPTEDKSLLSTVGDGNVTPFKSSLMKDSLMSKMKQGFAKNAPYIGAAANIAAGLFGQSNIPDRVNADRSVLGKMPTRYNVNPELEALKSSTNAIINDPNASANQRLAALAQKQNSQSQIYGKKQNAESAMLAQKAAMENQINQRDESYADKFRMEKMQTDANRANMITAGITDAAKTNQMITRDNKLMESELSGSLLQALAAADTDMDRYTMLMTMYEANGNPKFKEFAERYKNSSQSVPKEAVEEVVEEVVEETPEKVEKPNTLNFTPTPIPKIKDPLPIAKFVGTNLSMKNPPVKNSTVATSPNTNTSNSNVTLNSNVTPKQNTLPSKFTPLSPIVPTQKAKSNFNTAFNTPLSIIKNTKALNDMFIGVDRVGRVLFNNYDFTSGSDKAEKLREELRLRKLRPNILNRANQYIYDLLNN